MSIVPPWLSSFQGFARSRRVAGLADTTLYFRYAHAYDPEMPDLTSISATEELSYDPWRADLNADPYPMFRRFRDEAPLY